MTVGEKHNSSHKEHFFKPNETLPLPPATSEKVRAREPFFHSNELHSICLPAILIQTYDPFFIISNKICLLVLLHYPSHSGLLSKTTLIGCYQCIATPGTIIQPLEHTGSLISSVFRQLSSHLQPKIRKT